MLRRIIRVLAMIIGFIAGFQLFRGLGTLNVVEGVGFSPAAELGVAVTGGAAFGLIFYLITPILITNFVQLTGWLEKRMRPVPTQDFIYGSVGLFFGLILGVLISIPISEIPWMGSYLSLIVSLIMGYMGIIIVLNRKEEFNSFFSMFNRQGKKISSEDQGKDPSIKVLDTSVIIDGRIYDLCQTGFLEGTLMIPDFVLEELRHIADSSDLLKRNRGRRGLDILNKIQKEDDIDVKIYEGEVDETEVDSKLVKLAKQKEGKVVTNDYNLNKVSELQGVPVLNINELANAVKPVVLPGEEMAVRVIKDGKEAGQGVAYLDDGTMIVVDGGKRHIGDQLEVMVTSVLQTAAGRMIFAKPKQQFDKSHA